MSFFIKLSLFALFYNLATSGATSVEDSSSQPNATVHYSYDGVGNNLYHPEWGAAGSPRGRILPPLTGFYNADGDTPRDEDNSDLPSARRIMEQVFRRATPHKDKTSNDLLLQFGLFIVFDSLGKGGNSSEPFPIPCDGNLTDLLYCPVTGSSSNSIAFYRNAHHVIVTNENANRTSESRATISNGTSFLDLSSIYGTSEEDSANVRLREFGLLAIDDNGLPHDRSPRKYNSSPGCFAYFCLFMRFHNKVANQTRIENPNWNDEELFQYARHYTIAVYQSIVTEKYLPALLGDSLKPYTGYDPTVDPSIDEFFSSISFRYAHSSVSSVVRLLDENFVPTPQDPLFIRDVFRQPTPGNDVYTLVERHGGIEPFLRGMTTVPAKGTDVSFVDDVNVWCEATSVVDVQRARDVGIPPYNQVRRALGLKPMGSIQELVGDGDVVLTAALEELYGNDIEKLDAYVGALVEPKRNPDLDTLGWLHTLSIKDQFTRLRDGDRFWYQNRYTPEEYEAFPTLTDIIQQVCDGMELFPQDSYSIWNSRDSEQVCATTRAHQVSLLGGEVQVEWFIDDPSITDRSIESGSGRSIDVTLTAAVPMKGAGYIGIGWRTQEMNGAEIWFCTIDEDSFDSVGPSFPEECSETNNSTVPMFSCCLAPGKNHIKPECANSEAAVFYELEVVDWCLSTTQSLVTLRAPLCNDDDTEGDTSQDTSRNCFLQSSTPGGEIDLMVAFNPSDQTRPHGYQRRTHVQVDLSAGSLTQAESVVADEGLLAAHAIFMLFVWMLLAPLGVFIVRYMKTRSWRLVAHISLMSVVGGFMIPLLIAVEFSVGATDKRQDHAIVGLCLMLLFLFMVLAGRIRFYKLKGRKVGRKTAFIAGVFHKYGGLAIVGCAWWNCYTGLVRIGPEDSYVQVVLLSSFPMGYNMPIFGFIRLYIFWPYVCCVALIFLFAEIRKRRRDAGAHTKKLEAVCDGEGTIWDGVELEEHLEEMTMQNFLELTRLGSSLCIVDGLVLDISDFMEHHPGGRDMLRFASGSDITDEFAGARSVQGVKHSHSKSALSKMKTLVRAVLVADETSDEFLSLVASSRGFTLPEQMDDEIPSPFINRAPTTRVFRRGKVVDLYYITPSIEITEKSKPVVLLRLSLPVDRGSAVKTKDTPMLPSSTFTIRGTNSWGSIVERQYTPINVRSGDGNGKNGDEEEEIHEFLISLVAGGQMSKFPLEWKVGKYLLARGPTVNPRIVETAMSRQQPVGMFAAGTGIAPMLQLIDHYLSPFDKRVCPRMFLVWVLKSPKHNYLEEIALDERAKRSSGRLKWVVIYSSSATKRLLRRHGMSKIIPTQGDSKWSIPSMFSQRKRLASLKRIPSLCRTSSTLPADSESEIHFRGEEFTSQFWSEGASQCVTVQLNRSLVRDLLSSFQAYITEQDNDSPTPDEGTTLTASKEEEQHPSDEKASTIVVKKAFPRITLYVCGSPRFDEDMHFWLDSLGFPKENVLNFQASTVLV